MLGSGHELFAHQRAHDTELAPTDLCDALPADLVATSKTRDEPSHEWHDHIKGPRSMCTQVDKRWACGHVGFYRIKWCEQIFKTCKGTTEKHDIIDEKEECSDCERRRTLPKPLVSR